MDDLRIGRVVRTVRARRRLRQEDVARLAGVPRADVSQLERGLLENLDFRRTRRICGALEIRLDIVPRWRGTDLHRMLDGRHAAMAEEMAASIGRIDGWILRPEVSFSIYGERGVVDFLAWHPMRRAMLLIELKTELVEVGDLMATADRRRRLAGRIGREQGWDPKTIGMWIALANVSTNSRRVRQHATVLRAAFPAGGRSMARWLRAPTEPISCLSLVLPPQVSNARPWSARRVTGPRRPARDGSVEDIEHGEGPREALRDAD
jgi:transcriptional regulator with XRE-family HTH domain